MFLEKFVIKHWHQKKKNLVVVIFFFLPKGESTGGDALKTLHDFPYIY